MNTENAAPAAPKTADQILADLHDVLKAGHTQARTETAHARMIGDAHAGDYNEGRARGYAAAITAVLEARVAVTGQPVHTRQENADAFINAIINGTGAQQP